MTRYLSHLGKRKSHKSANSISVIVKYGGTIGSQSNIDPRLTSFFARLFID